MGFRITVHADAGLVVLAVDGRPTTQSFVEAIERYLADPDYQPHFAGVADLRYADFDPKSVDYRAISQHVVDSGRVKGRWICLVREPVETALSMLYANAVQATHEFKAFYTLEAAGQHLGIDLQPFFGVDLL